MPSPSLPVWLLAGKSLTETRQRNQFEDPAEQRAGPAGVVIGFVIGALFWLAVATVRTVL